VDGAQRRTAAFHGLGQLGGRELRAALLAVLADRLDRAFLEVHAQDRTADSRGARRRKTLKVNLS
jgi:hypothetical protein